MIPQAWKDLWNDPRVHAAGLGVLGYLSPFVLKAFLTAGHMTPEQWSLFVSEATQAYQHAMAAFGIIVPALITAVKVARELYMAPAGHVIVPLPATQVAQAANNLKPRPEGD